MRRRFDLIVFDWDGTLMDSAARIVESLRAAAADVGLEPLPDSTLRNVIGLGLHEALSALYPQLDGAGIGSFADRYRHHFLVAGTTPTPLFAGVMDMLESLAAQPILLGVATGKSRRGLDRAMSEMRCRQFFHATRCADETCSKPDPLMLRELMEELDVMPERTLMVGDTEYDMEMASRAGAAGLAVSYGVHEHERLRAHAPLACVNSVAELHVWLERALPG